MGQHILSLAASFTFKHLEWELGSPVSPMCVDIFMENIELQTIPQYSSILIKKQGLPFLEIIYVLPYALNDRYFSYRAFNWA